jgi:hypothetical protein
MEAAIVDDLFALMRAESRFIRFGVGRSIDSRRRAQQLTVDLICSASGGPCYYMGRHLHASHVGLRIVLAMHDLPVIWEQIQFAFESGAERLFRLQPGSAAGQESGTILIRRN